MQPSFKRIAERMGILNAAGDGVKAAPEPTEQWSKRVAETAVRLKETLEAIREPAPENPREEPKAAPQENPRIVRSKRVLQSAPGRGGGTWATKW